MNAPIETIRIPSASTIAAAALGMAVALFLLNYASVSFFNYPFAYCGGRWVVFNLGVAQIWDVGRLGVAGAVMVFIIMQRWRSVALFVSLLTILYVLPQWGDTLFRLGSACSEQEKAVRDGHLEAIPMLPPPAPLPPKKPPPPRDAPARP